VIERNGSFSVMFRVEHRDVTVHQEIHFIPRNEGYLRQVLFRRPRPAFRAAKLEARLAARRQRFGKFALRGRQRDLEIRLDAGNSAGGAHRC